MRNSPADDALFMFKLIALFLIATQAMFDQPNLPEIIAKPIPLFEQNLERDYLAPVSEYAGGHRGVDLRIDSGSELLSPVDGIINFADEVVDRGVVTVSGHDGKKYSFEPACTEKSMGSSVKKGEAFANHCEPSASYQYHCESCVHFSVRSEYGYLSPLYLLGKLRLSKLLT